jgi:hypothetical protein
MTHPRIEERLAALEEQVAELAKEIQRLHDENQRNGKTSWIEKITGSFQDDPEFEEILRLGREYRRSQTFETAG